jgi:hypothetical protein
MAVPDRLPETDDGEYPPPPELRRPA